MRIGDQSRRRHPPPLLPVPRAPHTVRHRHPRPFFHVVHPSSSRPSPGPFSVHISLTFECYQLVRSDHVSEVAQFPSFHHLQQPSLRHQLLQYGFVCSKLPPADSQHPSVRRHLECCMIFFFCPPPLVSNGRLHICGLHICWLQKVFRPHMSGLHIL